MHSPFNPCLPPFLVGLESSQQPQFVLLFKDQEQGKGTLFFSWKIYVKMHIQKASASLAHTLHPQRGEPLGSIS